LSPPQGDSSRPRGRILRTTSLLGSPNCRRSARKCLMVFLHSTLPRSGNPYLSGVKSLVWDSEAFGVFPVVL
jgi:hypothetical protein